jgi:2-iminobutanoate/2-iminopropanoate deaminase
MNDIIGHTDRAPQPAGPYSQSRRRGPIVACAGQAGIRPDQTVETGFGPQLRRTFENLRATLSAAGSGFDDVVQVRVFLTDTAHFGEMNEIYAEYFSEPYPVRTTVTVTLPAGLLVEVDLLAVVA